MSEHLDKAKAAVAAAGELDVPLDDERPPRAYTRLLDVALIQARLAQADALTRIADYLENVKPGRA